MTKEIRTETLSDGSIDYGNGVKGPSVVDIFVANNAKGSLPTSPRISRNTIFEVSALGTTSVMVAACGAEAPATQNNPTEAPVVTITPETPAPTVEVTPSAKPTPEPATGNVSPEPTLSLEPTEKPELKSRASLFEGKVTKPEVKKVTSDIKSVLRDNPKSTETNGESGWDEQKYLEIWKFCQKGNPDIGGDIESNKALFCEALIIKMYENYTLLQDEDFYSVTKEVLNYTIKTLPKDYIDGIKSNLGINS